MSDVDENHDSAVEATDEVIKVAIRMRPLNDSETSNNRVWKVLQKYNSIIQTMSTNKSPNDRLNGRTSFSYDKTFDEDVSTKEVYDSIARGILQSVMNGLNGTIFAYGQTNSGKTFTIQGSGTIEEGSQGSGTIEEGIGGKGGVIHMAAEDIFSYIINDPDRIFVVRVSFLEIYNEEVRDLLVSGNSENVLSIREDLRRGVFVNATESVVTDLPSLLRTLFVGEKKRSFASTRMNERSSRSHTIFRITVESREKPVNQNDDVSSDKDDIGMGSVCSDDGPVRISTLNLVDLAGSESLKHREENGDRLKEGSKINQSLLTLSRVISALGSSGQPHINFRDSKLTRILQPSLSGNARMAIICCVTPSELYQEETRSTLQFASRAKLVKTRAHINEVLNDRALIKKLQRELASIKGTYGISDTLSQQMALRKNQKMIASQAIQLVDRDSKIREREETIDRLLVDKKKVERLVISLQSQNEKFVASKGTASQEQDSEILKLKQRIKELELDNHKRIEQQQCLEKQRKSLEQETKSLYCQLDDAFEAKIRVSFELAQANSETEEIVKAKNETKEELEFVSSAVQQLNLDLGKNDVVVKDVSVRRKAVKSFKSKMLETKRTSLAQVQNLTTNVVEFQTELRRMRTEKEKLNASKRNLEDELELISSAVSQLEINLGNSKDVLLGWTVGELAESSLEKGSKLEESPLVKISRLATIVKENQSELDFSRNEKERLEHIKRDSEEQLRMISSIVTQLNAGLVNNSEGVLQELTAKNQNAEPTANKILEDKDTTLTKVKKMVVHMVELRSELERLKYKKEESIKTTNVMKEAQLQIVSPNTTPTKDLIKSEGLIKGLSVMEEFSEPFANKKSANEDVVRVQSLLSKMTGLQAELDQSTIKKKELNQANYELKEQLKFVSSAVLRLHIDLANSEDEAQELLDDMIQI